MRRRGAAADCVFELPPCFIFPTLPESADVADSSITAGACRAAEEEEEERDGGATFDPTSDSPSRPCYSPRRRSEPRLPLAFRLSGTAKSLSSKSPRCQLELSDKTLKDEYFIVVLCLKSQDHSCRPFEKDHEGSARGQHRGVEVTAPGRKKDENRQSCLKNNASIGLSQGNEPNP
ncbi:hypothetical protein EYF80_042216 [Liparis tanakae]|uniref:Uncharacterized protein n=1 Tax=Liparis tanakae TaxID=230148 RepID=A0A4Z2G478_9TELE|nr:hypothetical protein EYF80_042216 [Liparis tanakae]